MGRRRKGLTEAEAVALFGEDVIRRLRERWDGARPQAPTPAPLPDKWTRAAAEQAEQWRNNRAKPTPQNYNSFK